MENIDVRERIYENAKALAKIKGIKMSEIEKQTGISPGFLSRQTKPLSIEKVYRLAIVLQVSIADLTENDYWEEYKKLFAKDELKEAAERAAKVMSGYEVLKIVNDALKGQ